MKTSKIKVVKEIHDALDGLVEKATKNPGAPFVPEVLKRLANLKKEDRTKFENLRALLKHADIRVTELDKAIAQESGNGTNGQPTQADILLELTQDCNLFHAPDGTGYADVEVDGHRETWHIRRKGFRRWLVRRFYLATGGAPSSEGLQSALNVIEAQAQFDGSEREVYVRIAGLDGKIYLDLGDDAWRAVEISPEGWAIIKQPPVRFRRPAGMKSLPEPVRGGSVEMLRSFLNITSDDDFVLVVAWILAVLRDRGPYPLLVLTGEQGSAKSTFERFLKALLDPNSAPLRSLPRENRDLFIAATNGFVLTFDNVSGLPLWLSDTLSRLATGGGFATRQLYTDLDEVIFDATRPMILNGIEDFVTRPDLAQRAILFTLEAIPDECYKSEEELWAAFESVRPQILGALLDVVSHGLRQLPVTTLAKLPRMADFARWVTACETALWPAGTFLKAYAGNRNEAVDSVIENDPIGSEVRSLMRDKVEWTGTATDLLDVLDNKVADAVRKTKTWPVTPQALSGRLRRAATFLRTVGIDITFERKGRARTRTIRIFCQPEKVPMESSASSAASGEPNLGEEFSMSQQRTVSPPADGADVKIPAQSGRWTGTV